ncbi:PUA-like domain-containing protein [Cristinia sonorae]|uniref:PUA-like domain-containing protein n=1 Tax=Cristinia sonorae TaxID=1940300 RepID=A0A8K0UK06_9AGAR|nr:PUA-like domain-containing protein [Cristinia sonorae]
MPPKHWLMKAEPDSRIVKGKDVKFSVDDFQQVKTTAWEGVRNAEARNLMKEMKMGDKVLFYHSNCKNPGIAAVAEVTREAYPDYTAWDSSHPYYDEKTDKENPKWYMVDVTFQTRLPHFIPLSLLKRTAGSSTDAPEEELEYIGTQGVQAIKTMALVTRGRLSVQRVEEKTYDVLLEMGQRGGWDEIDTKKSKATKTSKKVQVKQAEETEGERDNEGGSTQKKQPKPARGKKRKAGEDRDSDAETSRPLRRSTRTSRPSHVEGG